MAAALVISGCSSSQLSRLAPPGIVKYEDIAGEKPPNAAIEAEIAAMKDARASRFPLISQTPAATAKPRRAPRAGIDAEAALLKADRAARDADNGDHEAVLEAEREGRELLEEEKARLAEQAEQDAAIAARERAAPMPSRDDAPAPEN